MVGDKKNNGKKMVAFEKRLIKFVDANIIKNLCYAERINASSIDPYLKNRRKNKVKIVLDNFTNLPNIKMVKRLSFSSPELMNFYKVRKGNFIILYLKNEKRYLPVPAQIGWFITENVKRKEKAPAKKGFVIIPEYDGEAVVEEILFRPKNVTNKGNIIPIKKIASNGAYHGLLSPVANSYMPSVIIIDDKYFLICLSAQSSIKNLVNCRNELSKVFNEHFKRKVGRQSTKYYSQTVFDILFSSLRINEKISVNKACQEIASKYKVWFKGIDWKTLKRFYFPEWKRKYYASRKEHMQKSSTIVSE